MTNYESISHLSDLTSLVYFVAFFAAALVYALWPRNKASFDEAATIPLRED
jgi:cytochrome c oxidase cbb3-type subunit 4